MNVKSHDEPEGYVPYTVAYEAALKAPSRGKKHLDLLLARNPLGPSPKTMKATWKDLNQISKYPDLIARKLKNRFTLSKLSKRIQVGFCLREGIFRGKLVEGREP